jgi:pimeloyl-ACP methyl ester carboxylesterase
MAYEWELLESGPDGAEQTVLLLPGGMCGAGSWREVMAEPALASARLVAATFPGQAGAPPLEDCSVANYARVTAELAESVGADVVAGFSMGACIAVEMLAAGALRRPAVLLGVSLSPKDEPAFFRGIVHLGSVLGPVPSAVLAKGAASMVKRIPASDERKEELRAEFRKNRASDVRPTLSAYLRWLQAHDRRAESLCETGVQTWVVHAEKGDGGLTAEERRTLEGCPHVEVLTIPGEVFFLPNEVPAQIADVIADALRAARGQPGPGAA